MYMTGLSVIMTERGAAVWSTVFDLVNRMNGLRHTEKETCSASLSVAKMGLNSSCICNKVLH